MLDSSRQLPNFFILGAMRAGTASLAHYLHQHPTISFTEPRATYFFQKEQLYQQGLDSYIRSFCRRTGGSPWRGEASPTYFAHPQLIGPRLRAHFGDAPLKFIVLVREPVSRAWSHYLFRVQQGQEERDFATALAEESEAPATSNARYFAGGCYVRLLKEWQNYYPLENFSVLLSEDLAADPLAQVQRVFKWLDVDATTAINVSGRLNRTRHGQKPEMMRLLGEGPAWLRTISERIWPNLWRRPHNNGSSNRVSASYDAVPTLDPTIATELRKRYEPEVLALSELLGRYLSHWLLHDELFERPVTNINL